MDIHDMTAALMTLADMGRIAALIAYALWLREAQERYFL